MFSVQFSASPLSALLHQLFQPWLSATPAQTGSAGAVPRHTRPAPPEFTAGQTPQAIADGTVFWLQSRSHHGAGHAGASHDSQQETLPEPAVKTTQAENAPEENAQAGNAQTDTAQTDTAQPATAKTDLSQAASSVTAATQSGPSQAQNGLSVALEAITRIADRMAQGEAVTQSLLDEVAAASEQAGATDETAARAESQSRAAAEAYRETSIMLTPLKRLQDMAADWTGTGKPGAAPGLTVTSGGLVSLNQTQITALQQRVDSLFELPGLYSAADAGAGHSAMR
ncbi:hypothetical protein SAMN04487991_0309 [Celeribacter neptunius]|uniref:Uncharacterized protein n=2 Tax=Celeribacter neptunius TaxID=588602 RepID=A0A1I3JC66_9RHOB|nr:hypothetical protein SAMN04487991_0309 [Celeribacter neptunius]